MTEWLSFNIKVHKSWGQDELPSPLVIMGHVKSNMNESIMGQEPFKIKVFKSKRDDFPSERCPKLKSHDVFYRLIVKWWWRRRTCSKMLRCLYQNQSIKVWHLLQNKSRHCMFPSCVQWTHFHLSSTIKLRWSQYFHSLSAPLNNRLCLFANPRPEILQLLVVGAHGSVLIPLTLTVRHDDITTQQEGQRKKCFRSQ